MENVEIDLGKPKITKNKEKCKKRDVLEDFKQTIEDGV